MVLRQFCSVVCLLLCLSACTASAPTQPQPEPGATVGLELPELAAVPLGIGEKLQVVATTNIVADVVQQVGGEQIDLYALLPFGVDPHGYQPTPQDLRALADADVIFINGLGLEEAMSAVFNEFASKVVVVNAGVELLEFADGLEGPETHARDEDVEEDHLHTKVDPHTWFRIAAVKRWADNIAQALAQLDPANATVYQTAANAYAGELDTLAAELAATVRTLPEARRKLVSDHDALGYFAHEFGFEIVGAVIPGFSTLAEPSARQLAALQDQIQAENVQVILVSATGSQNLERQIAQDLAVAVVPIYTETLSEAGGPAESYVELMRHNIAVVVEALR